MISCFRSAKHVPDLYSHRQKLILWNLKTLKRNESRIKMKNAYKHATCLFTVLVAFRRFILGIKTEAEGYLYGISKSNCTTIFHHFLNFPRVSKLSYLYKDLINQLAAILFHKCSAVIPNEIMKTKTILLQQITLN